MASYKYDSAYDWFTQYVQRKADDPQALRSMLLNLTAQYVSADDLQDTFQDEMEADGFFDDLDTLPEGYSLGHDINGFFVVEPGEEDPDEDGYSAGFDGRPHYATEADAIAAAREEVGA